VSRRPSRAAIVAQLKLASRKGDRSALTLALEQMKTLAYSPRYWERYLDLLRHPLARLIDLTVIKQGEKIARQKGWVKPKRAEPRPSRAARAPRPRRNTRPPAQPFLFPDLDA
jgi:hypothetical protein